MKKAQATRLKILQEALHLMYEQGYQATSIDEIIARTQVTKGAFYYHFKNKDEMGLAIMDELLTNAAGNFIQHSNKEAHPLDAIYDAMYRLLMKNELLKVQYGCPVSNFVQELTPWHAAFSTALNKITDHWMNTMTTVISKGKANGVVRKDVHAKQATTFIMSGYWGIRNYGKLENNQQAYLPYLKELKRYLESMKK